MCYELFRFSQNIKNDSVKHLHYTIIHFAVYYNIDRRRLKI